MKKVYFDSETSGLDPFTSQVTLIQTYYDNKIRLTKPKPENTLRLKNLLETNLLVGHALKFDLKFLKYHHGIEPVHLFDTQLAEILISGGQKARQRNTTTLKALAEEYVGIQLNKDEALRQSFKSGDLTPEQIQYAAMDVAVLPEIHEKQQELIKELGLEAVFATEMSCIPAVVWLELSGAPIDIQNLKKLEQETKAKLESTRLQVLTIFKESGYKNLDLAGLPSINLDSPLQLKKALWAIDQDVEDTNDTTLSSLKHPIGKVLKEYRKQQKLLNTFLEKLPKHINPITNRIHADFNQYGTLAGRFSCSAPNLQQLPRDDSIRALFKSNNGSKIITADYSQVELRILAEVSREPKFIELFNSGGDLHKLTAALIFNKSLEQVTKEERYISKAINFGLSYGMSWVGLQGNLMEQGIEITKEQAKDYISTFFRNYSKVNEYLERASKYALANNQIRNIAGRLIKYHPPANEKEQGFIAREGKNNPIQSLNADILKLAMGQLYAKLKPYNVKLINAIHDELVFETTAEQAEVVANIIKKEMEAAAKEYIESVPVIVEVKVGEGWTK